MTIAGGGLAGLSAAVSLCEAGVPVSLSDSAAQFGGRCRSYHDPILESTIDNGNHLVLSGNVAVARYLATIGAISPLTGPDHADFAFVDLASAEKWTVAINDGRMPWWILSPRRRVPGTRSGDYFRLVRLLKRRDQRIDQRLTPSGPLWRRLVDPILRAVLNTAPEEASAALAGQVLRDSLARGGRATRPRTASVSLSASFIDPAVDLIERSGAAARSGRRLRSIDFSGNRVVGLDWNNGRQDVAADEAVILAVPPWVAVSLVPGLSVPTEHRAIVNAHFAFTRTLSVPNMLGLVGGTAEWLFVYPDRISVTVSGADDLLDRDRAELAATFWHDIQRAYGISDPMPRWQIVKERRATFAATPEQNALRPGPRTAWTNLFLAGDWVDNGLPATIEGALRSGDTAARLASGRAPRYGYGDDRRA